MVKLLLAFLFMLTTTTGWAQSVSSDDLKLELSFEERSSPLYTGEMVLLKVRGFYKIRIAREKIIQSDLDGFDWMQLGEDTWTKDKTKGHEILQLERIIALFPNRAGTLEIKPFDHQLELWTRTGERYDHTLTSDPISIEVTERPDTHDWWLPARRLTVEDNWSNPPDQLGTGEGALRVVTITVEGVLPQHLPPMPKLESAGAYVFPHPERRIKRLYKRGPVTRVFWRWTVRPENPPSAYLKPIRLPYFDTKTREHREIVIAAQRIAMTDEAMATYVTEANSESVALLDQTLEREGDSNVSPRLAGIVAPFGFLGGVLGGLIFMIPGMRWRRFKRFRGLWNRLRPDPDIAALRKAVSLGDAIAARRAGVKLFDKGKGDIEGLRQAIIDFDQHIFGIPKTEPDLKRFKASILRSLRQNSS